MGIGIKLPESCSNSILEEGSRLLQSESYFAQERNQLPDGSICLQAKMRDTFYFVDHPWVELDAAGAAVTDFRCDCPDFRANRGFCAHCAALVLDFAPLNGAVHAAGDLPEEEDEDFDDEEFEEDEFEEEEEEEPEEESQGNALPQLTEFSYAFCNSAWDLYPRVRNPRIPLERYVQAFGNNARALSMYRAAGVWGGSCFGMAATAAMFRQGKEDTRITDFNPEAAIPSQLQLSDRHAGLDLTLHQFVELMQLLQYAECVRSPIRRNRVNPLFLEKFAQQVRSFQEGQSAPAVMCIWATPKLDGGHAVLPYRLETGEKEDIVHIYDPNWPLKVRYAYLTKDAQGYYKNWRFPMNDRITYSGDLGSQVSMAPYESCVAAWDGRASAAADNILSVAAGVAIQSEAGQLLARVTEQGVETYADTVYQIPQMAGPGDDKVMLSIPAGCYRFCQEDPMAQELSVHMIGTDLSVNLSTTAREALVQVDDESAIAAVRIAQAESHYKIEILNTIAQAQEEIFLSGMVGEIPLQLMHRDGRLYADGLTQQCALYINDVQQSLDSIQPLTQELPEELEPVLNAAKDSAEAESDT